MSYEMILEAIEESADDIDYMNDKLTSLAERAFDGWEAIRSLFDEIESVLAEKKFRLERADINAVMDSELEEDEGLAFDIPLYTDAEEEVYNLRMFVYPPQDGKVYVDLDIRYDWESDEDEWDFDEEEE